MTSLFQICSLVGLDGLTDGNGVISQHDETANGCLRRLMSRVRGIALGDFFVILRQVRPSREAVAPPYWIALGSGLIGGAVYGLMVAIWI